MIGTLDHGPYDFLDEVDLHPPKDYVLRVRPFMLEVCDRLAHRLPVEATSALRVAHDFQRASSDIAELVAARVACWNYLGNRSCGFQDPEVNAVRAVICTLFPASEDAFETTHNFLDFAVGAGLPEQLVLAIMRAHFITQT